jgi:hypothetical protein
MADCAGWFSISYYYSIENPTPAPWSNVLANPIFGTIVTESGVLYMDGKCP